MRPGHRRLEAATSDAAPGQADASTGGAVTASPLRPPFSLSRVNPEARHRCQRPLTNQSSRKVLLAGRGVSNSIRLAL
jgi:hypothetical protein